MSERRIRVIVCGAVGRMGREVVRAVVEAEDMELVAAIDREEIGKDAGEIAGVGGQLIPVNSDLTAALKSVRPDVLVDFTVPDSVMENLRAAFALGVSPVVGTTGLT